MPVVRGGRRWGRGRMNQDGPMGRPTEGRGEILG